MHIFGVFMQNIKKIYVAMALLLSVQNYHVSGPGAR